MERTLKERCNMGERTLHLESERSGSHSDLYISSGITLGKSANCSRPTFPQVSSTNIFEVLPLHQWIQRCETSQVGITHLAKKSTDS